MLFDVTSLQNLVCATSYYFYMKYTMIHVPWWVGREAYYMTKPADAGPDATMLDGSFFVASGEQSVIQMVLDGTFPSAPRRWMCLTPCVRLGQIGSFHSERFMKLELISTVRSDIDGGALSLAMNARSFFQGQAPDLRTSIVKTEVGWDVVANVLPAQLELGSYGVREVKPHGSPVVRFAYGTGCAEPRFSTVERSSRATV